MMYNIIAIYLLVEYNQKTLLGTWGLEPTSPGSVNRLVASNAVD